MSINKRVLVFRKRNVIIIIVILACLTKNSSIQRNK